MSCCVVGCRSRKGTTLGVTFHKFPKKPEIRSAWVKAVNRKDWKPNKNSLICSLHFESHMLDFTKYHVLVKRDAVPTKFEGFPPHTIKFVYLPDSEPTHQESKKPTCQEFKKLTCQEFKKPIYQEFKKPTRQEFKKPTCQESKKPKCKHLIDQQESFNQALYAKLLKKTDLSLYPVSISKESRDNLIDGLTPEIECLQCKKESSISEIKIIKHKIEILQQENESLSEENEILKRRVDKLERGKEFKRKEVRTLQQYKRRFHIQMRNLKGIINSLKENRTTDDYLHGETSEFGDNKSDEKFEKRNSCLLEVIEEVVRGHIDLPEEEKIQELES